MNTRAMLLLFLILPALANAYSVQGVDSLLRSYNVSSTVIGSATLMNFTYNNHYYVALQNPSKQFIFLVNVSSQQYSLILNSSDIAAIMRTQLLTQSLSSINFANLNRQMGQFQNSSAGSLNSCLTETGLDRATCTASNFCQSCTEVPVCNKVLSATSGPFGVVGEGIMSFEVEYTTLENAFSQFNSATSGINANNVDTNVGLIVGSFQNISSSTVSIAQNPLFPPPQNADYTQCGGTGTSTSNTAVGGPWYCNSVGFCEYLTYNYTKLNQIQSTVTQIQALPITDAQINQLAVNVSNTEEAYVGPALIAQKSKLLGTTLNTTLSGYNASINAAILLLTRISNQSLSSAMASLQANYSNLKSNYLTLNISTYSTKLASQLTAFKAKYNAANQSYSSLVQLSKNNTALLLQLQLNSGVPSQESTTLSFKEIALNGRLNSKINNTAALAANLSSINREAASLLGASGPNPLVEFVRAVDGPFVRAVLGAMNAPFASAVGEAPLISVLLSLIIGIIILALLYAWYMNLQQSRRLAVNPRTRKNWNTLFALSGAVFIVYLLATYALASSANSSAPAGAFQSTLHGSKSLAIVYNGTPTASMINCSSQISAAATSAGKSAQVLRMQNSTCLSNGTTVISNCLGQFASKDTPVIVLTQSNATQISVYSYYGTIMYASGSPEFMNSCPAATLVR